MQHTDLQPRQLIFVCVCVSLLLRYWTAQLFVLSDLIQALLQSSFHPSCLVVTSLIPCPPPYPFSGLSPRCLQFPSLEPTQPAPGVFECSALWNSRPLDSNLPTPLNRHSLDRRFVTNILICMREGKNVTWLVKGLVHNWSVFMLCAECNEKRAVRETAVDFHVCISWL